MPTESTAPLGRIAWYYSHGIGGRPPSGRGGLRTTTRFVAQTALTPASSGGMHLYLRGPLDARGGRSLRSFAVIFRIVSEAPLTWHRLLNERRIEPEIAQEGPGLGASCSGTSARCAPTSALGRPAPRVARLAHLLAHLLARTAPRTAKAPRVAGPSQTPGQGLELWAASCRNPCTGAGFGSSTGETLHPPIRPSPAESGQIRTRLARDWHERSAPAPVHRTLW